ncbi:MAG: HAMP domain-containing histidine kinase [Spirochaetes bacterium]|nr:HAMP domain-containing histidine kinase [Spirochaetota bacterium]MBU0956078.1 HAMP domain-containing histidine kinase [Spirochaetota bacterium]
MKDSGKPLSIFSRSLLVWLSGFLLVILVLSLALFFSYRYSAASWNSIRRGELEKLLAAYIQDPAAAVRLPDDVALFVYDLDNELLFSNRGSGRRRIAADEVLRPVVIDGRTAAWYSAGSLEFHESAANQSFLNSMLLALLLSLLLSLLAAAAMAWLFARSLSKPARMVQAGLDRIRSGNLDLRISEQGPAELRSIALAANDLTAQLQHEHVLRRQWVQDIVHDLRTPITALQSQFEAMIDGVLPPDPARLSRLQAELGRVQALVAAFEDLMRLEAPDFSVTAENFSAQSFLAALDERFKLLQTSADQDLQTECQVEKLYGDETLLFRAVSNLLDNALKYGDTSRPLRLVISTNGSDLHILVHNYGTPIPETMQQDIFERLFRGDFSRPASGSGLGLSIARRIVQLHSGSITVQSAAETGTSFLIKLPRGLANS